MGTLLDFLINNLPQFRRARLPSLYSDFRQQRHSNPDGYAANIAAWEAALALAAERQVVPGSTDLLSIPTGPALLEALNSPEWGAPLALGAAISEAAQHGRFVPRAAFLHARPGAVESTSTSTPWRLASWALELLGVSSWIPDRLPTERFVILANLKKAFEKLQQFISEPRGRVEQVMPVVVFRTAVSQNLELERSMSDDDLQILLMYLSRDRKLLAYNDTIVKFRTTAAESLQITEQDQSVGSLKMLISELSAQTEDIMIRIEGLNQQARSAISNKDRNAALRHLKLKKIQEAVLAQRSDTLIQLEGVLNQIEQAINQVEVMAVLKSSTGVLKTLNAEIGDAESLQDVLDNINEEMMKTHEISNAIGDTTQAGLVIDEGEVDKELAMLEAEAQTKKTREDVDQVQERLQHLSVPQEEPSLAESTRPMQRPVEEM